MLSVQGTLAIILPDEVKGKLIEVLPLLNQDVGQLIQDVEPIRAIFKQIQGQLPRDLKAKMLQVTFIENRYIVVQEAQDLLEKEDIKSNLLKIGRSWTASWPILLIELNSNLILILISTTVLIA
jgi:hypothetical protein